MTFKPRTIKIVCHGKDLRDGGQEHSEVELTALVSYEWNGTEWWDADSRADHQDRSERELAPGRPDIAWAITRSSDRFTIACAECGRTFSSGDLLGSGFRTRAELLAEHRAGLTAAKRLEAQRPNHRRLTMLADSGALCLSLTGLDRMMQKP